MEVATPAASAAAQSSVFVLMFLCFMLPCVLALSQILKDKSILFFKKIERKSKDTNEALKRGSLER